MPTIALTRDVSPSVDRCELTHLTREIIDAARASAQHERYRELLGELGCEVRSLPAEPELPDCVFIEDTALVLDEVAILTRPGAVSRRPELAAVRAALEPFRPLLRIRDPGTLDGGDVLRAGRTLYVGRSTRTNQGGVEQLEQLLEAFGYRVVGVDFHSCLHLKSAATLVADELVLVQEEWVDPKSFGELTAVAVDPSEPHGGNALRLGDTVLYPSGFDRTRRRLERHGLDVRTVDLSELAKAEGGVTCCSLIFEAETG